MTSYSYRNRKIKDRKVKAKLTSYWAKIASIKNSKLVAKKWQGLSKNEELLAQKS